jgi:filamentous hemagglutinin family protein
MNHIYRLVWSKVLSCWVAVAETARGRGKSASRKLIAAALALTAVAGQAAPVGGQVVAGTGSIAQSGATTTISQSSQNLSLNWDSFNVAKHETVNFVQPSASAIAVNRIFDTNGSRILGNINANGQVYLINPNGILFGQGAQVNVGALVASTLDLNDASLNGNTRLFSGNGAGSIINQGTINAGQGGYVALLGNVVSNEGTITAPLGTVALGAGNAVTLDFNGNSLVKMQIDQSVLDSEAGNGGLIRADGGMVFMSAGARDTLLASVVNNTGVIEARTVENRGGVIILLGGMAAGTTHVSGTLDASAPDTGNGGFIETSAAHVKVADGTVVTTRAENGQTGKWLIDPTNINIAASGGDLSGDTVMSSLANTHFEIATDSESEGNGDIFVNQALTWTSANTLTLKAHRNIEINQAITASVGGLSLDATGAILAPGAVDVGRFTLTNGNWEQINSTLPAFKVADFRINGGSFLRALIGDGGASVYQIADVYGLQGMASSTLLGKNFGLAGNIDASGTAQWNDGAGFVPIGNASNPFTGSFDGFGHAISNLTINRPSTYNVGLFGYTGTGSTIDNVGLVDGGVNGGTEYVGGMVGQNHGTLSNSYVVSDVSGIGDSYYVGGLVGRNAGTIINSYFDGVVNGATNVGGVVGLNEGSIKGSYSSGVVVGSNRIGGLVGVNESAIENSYSSSTVISDLDQDNYGGLVGINVGTINNSYADGLMRVNQNQAGGLIGFNFGTVNNSYWNTESSGQTTSAGGVGLDNSQMKMQENFTSATTTNGNNNPDWDFTSTWLFANGSSAPLLKALMTNVTVTADNSAKTYDGTKFGGAYTVTTDRFLSGDLNFTGASQNAINAGSYSITPDIKSYANKQYVIVAVDGTLTIDKAQLTVTANDASRIFGVANPPLTSTVSGFVNGETLANSGVSGAGSASTSAGSETSVGTAKIIAGVGSLKADNYDFVSLVDGTLTINDVLSLAPGIAAEQVSSAITQIQASTLAPQASSQTEMADLSSSITVIPGTSSAAATSGEAAGAGNGVTPDTRMAIGQSGSTLQIVNGGVNLPDQMVAINE